MKRITALALVATLILVMLASAPPASADSYLVRFFDFTGTCSADGLQATGWESVSFPTDVQLAEHVTFEALDLDEIWPGYLFPAIVYTAPSGLYLDFVPPLASNTYSISYRFDVQVDGVSVGSANATFRCDGGVFSFVSSSWDGNFSGPTVPQGFVQRTIICDVAVFDVPGGAPVGSNRITAGQTFFVGSESTAGPDGELWSQVFVSSFVSPWIPTRCVGQ